MRVQTLFSEQLTQHVMGANLLLHHGVCRASRLLAAD